MLLILWAGVILGSIIFKKSRVYSALIIIFGICLFTFSNDNADSINYLMSYNNLKSGDTAVFSGNVLSNLVFYLAGLFNNYTISRFIFSSLSFGLIYKGGKKYTENINVILGLFLIAPFVIDATQIKSCASMAVFFCFSYYLFRAFEGENRKKNISIYLMGVLIASLFHFSYVLTIAYVAVVYFDKRKIAITAFVINAVGFTVFGMTRINAIMDAIAGLIPNFQNIFTRLRVSSTLLTEQNYLFRIRTVGIFYVILSICYIVLLQNKRSVDDLNEKNPSNHASASSMAEFVFRLNILTLVYLPLMPISMEIYRIQRDLLIVDYTYLSTLVIAPRRNEKHWFLILKISNMKVLTLGLIIAVYYLFFEAVYGNIDSVFLPLFHMTR